MKESQEVTSEVSNKICCYQAGKRMNFKITFTQCSRLKEQLEQQTIEENVTLLGPFTFSRSQVQAQKKLPQCSV